MNQKGESGSRRERRTLARLAIVEAVWVDIRASIAKKPIGRLIFYPSVVRVVESYNSGALALPPAVHETFPRLAVSTVVNWFKFEAALGEGGLTDRWGDRDTSKCYTVDSLLLAAVRQILERDPEMPTSTVREALQEATSGYDGPIPSKRTLQRVILGMRPGGAEIVSNHSRRPFLDRFPRVRSIIDKIVSLNPDASVTDIASLVAAAAQSEAIPAPSYDTVRRYLSKRNRLQS